MNHSAKNQGFSLIELLVTIVIFSVGMLAVAGLQTVSKRANFEALQRTIAAHAAFGLIEDMRTNGNGIDVYRTAANLGGGSLGAEPVPNCSGAGGGCNTVQKAAHDLWFWENFLDGAREVGAQGPSGGVLSPTICINGPAGGGAGVYVVAVAWRGTVALSNPIIDNCGAGSGQYGDNNEFRRVVQIPTFIDPSI
jgi:type IV pilus assembly protein PilV